MVTLHYYLRFICINNNRVIQEVMHGSTWLSSLTQQTFAQETVQETPPGTHPAKAAEARGGKAGCKHRADRAPGALWHCPSLDFARSPRQLCPSQSPSQGEPAKESSAQSHPAATEGTLPPHLPAPLQHTVFSATETSGAQLDITRLGHLCSQTDTFCSISSPRFP